MIKCIKLDVGYGSSPDPAVETYSAPPDPLAGFQLKRKKGREGVRGRGWKGQGEKGRRVPSFFLTDLATLDGETKCDVARLAAQKLLFHFFSR